MELLREKRDEEGIFVIAGEEPLSGRNIFEVVFVVFENFRDDSVGCFGTEVLT